MTLENFGNRRDFVEGDVRDEAFKQRLEQRKAEAHRLDGVEPEQEAGPEPKVASAKELLGKATEE